MEEKAFKTLVTNITLVLHNYLQVAKQSGRITLILDAKEGIVTRCVVANSMEVSLEGLKKDA